jgi:hypothetical protein
MHVLLAALLPFPVSLRLEIDLHVRRLGFDVKQRRGGVGLRQKPCRATAVC